MTTDPEEIRNQMTDKEILIEKDIEVEVGREKGRGLRIGVEIEKRGVVPEVKGVDLEIEVVPEIEIRDQKLHESLEIIEVPLKSAEVGLAVVLEAKDREGVPIVGVEVTQKKENIGGLQAKRRAVNINSFVKKKTFA